MKGREEWRGCNQRASEGCKGPRDLEFPPAAPSNASSSPISLGGVILPDKNRSAPNISLSRLLPVPPLVETLSFSWPLVHFTSMDTLLGISLDTHIHLCIINC